MQQGLGCGGFVSGYFLSETSTAVLNITSFLMQATLTDMSGRCHRVLGTVARGWDEEASHRFARQWWRDRHFAC